MFHYSNHPAKMLIFLIIFSLTASISHSQQQYYSGNLVMQCNNSDRTGPSPSFLYTCNHKRPSCKAFLMFRSKPPYASVSSISELTYSDPKEFAMINNVSSSAVFLPDNAVIVPVSCSCTGQYYQANTSYVVRHVKDTYFTIANETFQGLTTCDALKRENPYGEFDLFRGLKLQVPLRCACPTEEQIECGINFVLTFLVTGKDTVPEISEKFNVSAKNVAEANGFSDENPLIYPFTTILIPLPKEPLSSQIISFHPKATSSPGVPQKRKVSHKEIYLGTGIGAALAVFFFLLLLGFFYYRRKATEASWRIRQVRNKQKLPENLLNKIVETLKIYTFEELKVATDNFNPQRRLSKSVYRGILHGKLLAIKKKITDVSKEIKILGSINHFNLISLYGVCQHGGVFYLVYEFLEEGSLKDWLHKEDSSLAHSWNHRILIALDIANGLYYLHNFSSPAYVHKDIKSCNILLNRNLRAKIANFSLARENGNLRSDLVIGEKGYMAPEYIQAGKTSPKLDVYAFGVVLLELITGREAVFLRNSEEVLLSETVVSVMDGTDGVGIRDLIDPRLQVKNPLGYIIDHAEIASRLLRLGAACLARDAERRLSTAEVVSALMKIQLDVQNSQSFSIG